MRTQQPQPDVLSPFWRRALGGLSVVGLVLGFLLGVEFASLAQVASSEPVVEAARALREGLSKWAIDETFEAAALEGLLGGEGEGSGQGRRESSALGVIRGLKNAAGAFDRGIRSAAGVCSSLALASFLLALGSAGALLLLGGPRGVSEGLASALLVTGVSCLVAWGATSVAANKITPGLEEAAAVVGQGLAREFQRFQLQVGLPCLLIGLVATILLSRIERPGPGASLPVRR